MENKNTFSVKVGHFIANVFIACIAACVVACAVALTVRFIMWMF